MSGYHGKGKASTKRSTGSKDLSNASGSVHVEFAMDELRETLRQGMYSLCTAAGLAMLYRMMEEDVEALIGPKGKHNANRVGFRHGTQECSVVLSGQRITVQRPRVRSTDGSGELPVETYEVARRDDLLFEAALARMMHGLSSRNYLKGQEPLPEGVEGYGSTKSSVSRRFIQATQGELKRLLGRRLDSLNICVLLLDGVEFAETTVVVAMGIDRTGAKHVLGLRLGATENAAVCKDLLTDLAERGLHADDGLLAIIDGAKALRSALKAVFGERVIVQRCRVHKKRNVLDYLPKEQRPWVKRQLTKAWAMQNADQAISALKGLATHLETQHPDAANSLREGLEETVTVMRLGVSGLLQKSLSTTNAIESAFDIVRTHTRNVKRWRNGNMIQRWTAAGLLAAETRFRKIKGYKEMQKLHAGIRRLTIDKVENGENERKTA